MSPHSTTQREKARARPTWADTVWGARSVRDRRSGVWPMSLSLPRHEASLVAAPCGAAKCVGPRHHCHVDRRLPPTAGVTLTSHTPAPTHLQLSRYSPHALCITGGSYTPEAPASAAAPLPKKGESCARRPTAERRRPRPRLQACMHNTRRQRRRRCALHPPPPAALLRPRPRCSSTSWARSRRSRPAQHNRWGDSGEKGSDQRRTASSPDATEADAALAGLARCSRPQALCRAPSHCASTPEHRPPHPLNHQHPAHLREALLAARDLARAGSLVLGAPRLQLVRDVLLADLLRLLLVDRLHQHALVLVHVTLDLQGLEGRGVGGREEWVSSSGV